MIGTGVHIRERNTVSNGYFDDYSQLVGLVGVGDRHRRWTQPAETRQCAPGRLWPERRRQRHIGGVQFEWRKPRRQCVDLYWIRGCGCGRVDDHEPALARGRQSPGWRAHRSAKEQARRRQTEAA